MESARIIRCNSDASFVDECVARIEDEIILAVAREKIFLMGMSGGSTAGPIYRALAKKSRIDWSNVEVFLIDERYVAPDHPESNQRMIRDSFVTATGISNDRYHVPNTLLPLDRCIEDYNEQLKKLFQGREPQLLLLGMGEDGHVASLFPNDHIALKETLKTVLHTKTHTFAVQDRITVSLPVLRGANKRIFMIKGVKKNALLTEMIAAPKDPLRWPAQEFTFEGTTWIAAS